MAIAAQDLRTHAQQIANARELEITRSISLRQLDAAALMDLRITGVCSFELPEWLFNMDYPDHYLRRIKSVSVTLPCVVGPYSGISGTLTMLSGRVRRSPTPGAGYGDESNFRASNLAATSIAVSSAQGDSGLFDFNLRDERFLPFEGAGLVDSQWRFSLPQHLRPFDYETISDLVLTIRYTARASSALRQPAIEDLNTRLGQGAPQLLLIDVKRDFPAEWARALANVTNRVASFQFKLERLHFPYAFAHRASNPSGRQAWIRLDSGPLQRMTPQPFSATPDGSESWTVSFSLPTEGKELKELLLAVEYTLGN